MSSFNDILVCDQLEKSDMFKETKKILDEKFKVVLKPHTITEYIWLQPKEKKEELKNKLRFVFFHADDTENGGLCAEIFKEGIPIILVKGKDKQLSQSWYGVFEELGLTDEETCLNCGPEPKKCLECIGKMIYTVDNIEDIRGAMMWVNNYYHPSKEKALECERRKMLERNTQKKKELRYEQSKAYE